MLVITSGDPYSVTVEILALLLAEAAYVRRIPVVIIGSAWHWRDQSTRLGLTLPDLRPVRSLGEVRSGGVSLLDIGEADDAQPAEQLTSHVRGGLAVRALERLRAELTSIALPALAVVTAPIDKYDCQAAGYKFPGQTEFFEHIWGGQAVMTLAGPRLRVGLVTNHLALRDVPTRLNIELISQKLTLFRRTLTEFFAIQKPRIAVVGLNPHASDRGLFGDEELRLIAPAIESVRSTAGAPVEISGPLPADTAFYHALHGKYDGVLAMYHDQGLGPLKTVHFDDAVNLSGGLRHFRASPDHGPARDLFLAGKASNKSMAAALALAVDYLDRHGGAPR